MANRLESCMYLIGKQQTGFIRGRFITTNIMKTREIVAHLKKTNKPGLVVMVDYEKCFDRVDHNSIEAVLRYFNFGERFIKMYMTIFRNFWLCTVNNGYTSEFFRRDQGLGQGSPDSPGMYLLCGEIMAHLIKQCSQVKGITVHDIESILSQFTDDTGAFLRYESLVVENFCRILQETEKQLGLKVSYEKTNIYRVRSIWKSNARLYTSKQLNWTNEPIETLGVKIACDGSIVQENFDKILTKMQSVCSLWKSHMLNIMSKITVVNSLMGSLFVYKMSVLVNMTMEQLDKTKRIIHKFL